MCVSSRPRSSEEIRLRERQTRFPSSVCGPKLRVARITDFSLSTSVLQFMHARTDEENYVKCLQVSRVQDFGDLKQQRMERGKHQSTGKSSYATSS